MLREMRNRMGTAAHRVAKKVIENVIVANKSINGEIVANLTPVIMSQFLHQNKNNFEGKSHVIQ